ncbi:MAG: ankyrin repeat domain-containing protein [Candidatus Micrarchaeota archaeon]|nr:ankyrin repeat domain-containing protein [Candidatus Micrarchaeota archaeon]
MKLLEDPIQLRHKLEHGKKIGPFTIPFTRLNPNKRIRGRPLLELAIENDLRESAYVLVEHGATVTARSLVEALKRSPRFDWLFTPSNFAQLNENELFWVLYTAGAVGLWPVFNQLVDQAPDHVLRMRTPKGRTLYHVALETPFLKKLLERVEPEIVADEYGFTPFHLLAKRGSTGALALLLETTNQNINAQDHKGNTALHYAVNRVKKVMLLLEHGADPLIVNQDGDTFLHKAAHVPKGGPLFEWAYLHHPELLEMRNNQGKTPLELATPNIRKRLGYGKEEDFKSLSA